MPDLSRFSDQELNNLFWAAHDMNAAAMQLISAGLIIPDQQIDFDDVFGALLREAGLRDRVNTIVRNAS